MFLGPNIPPGFSPPHSAGQASTDATEELLLTTLLPLPSFLSFFYFDVSTAGESFM